MRFMKYVSVLSSALLLTACLSDDDGGSASTTQKDAPEPAQTGYFVDAPVKGLRYSTESMSGTTDRLGKFQYRPEETVTFSIGATELGSATGGELLTPVSLNGAGTTDSNRATNVARILITLDADRNPLNGIEIGDRTHEAFSGISVNLSQAPGDLDALQVLQQALSEVQREGLVSVQLAREHLNEFTAKLPETITESSIRSLIDESPNYSGRQTPMTPSLEALRKGIGVFWGDPDTSDINALSLRQWLVADDITTWAEAIRTDEPLPSGITASGTADGTTELESASLTFTFDQYVNDDWTVSGEMQVAIESTDKVFTHGNVGDSDYATITFDAHEIAMDLNDLRFSNGNKTFGLHGDATVIAGTEPVDNDSDPYSISEHWELDLVMREVNTDRNVRIRTVLPMAYMKPTTGFAATYDKTHSLTVAARVLHWELGAYVVEGVLEYGEKAGEVTQAAIEVLDSQDGKVGKLMSIPIPDYMEITPLRVRASLAKKDEEGNEVYDVYKLQSPLTGESLEDTAPVWDKYTTYKVETNDQGEMSKLVILQEPRTLDPDGDQPRMDYDWIYNNKVYSTNPGISGNIELGLTNLDLTNESGELIEICLRTIADYKGLDSMYKDVAFALDNTPDNGEEYIKLDIASPDPEKPNAVPPDVECTQTKSKEEPTSGN